MSGSRTLAPQPKPPLPSTFAPSRKTITTDAHGRTDEPAHHARHPPNGHDFASDRVASLPSAFFQPMPRFRFGSPSDPLEREADRVANEVMRPPGPRDTAVEALNASALRSGAPPAVNRNGPARANDDERVDRNATGARADAGSAPAVPASGRPLDDVTRAFFKPRFAHDFRNVRGTGAHAVSHSDAHAAVQMKSVGAPDALPAEARSIAQSGLRSPGHALDAATRQFMESRIGFDLSQVRIHTDSTAAASANALSASAFTRGNNIVFAEGQYRPETTEGRGLLAHELTHVAQQRGGGAVLQRKESKKEEVHSTWGTAPAIVKIKVDQGKTGTAWGYYADGDMTLIEIRTNTLGPGVYTIIPTGAPQGSTDSDYVQQVSPRFVWRQPVSNFRPNDAVTVIVEGRPVDRFAALPDYIKNYLRKGRVTGLSESDLDQLADEGERLLSIGTTAADLATAADPSTATRMEGKTPPEDLVDSLRRRGFSDFPSRDDYYRRLAWELVNSPGYRSWWTNDVAAAYWKELPDQAADDWNKFADKLYTKDKQAEEAAWQEAFRRIDAAAGVANAIAVVTLVVAGGFAGGFVEIPALPATIQGVPTGVWAKAVGGTFLAKGFTDSLASRIDEAGANSNPVSIVAAAFGDATGVSKLFEAIQNRSFLTGEKLGLDASQRAGLGVTGIADFIMTALGVSELAGPAPRGPRPTSAPDSPAATPREPISGSPGSPVSPASPASPASPTDPIRIAGSGERVGPANPTAQLRLVGEDHTLGPAYEKAPNATPSVKPSAANDNLPASPMRALAGDPAPLGSSTNAPTATATLHEPSAAAPNASSQTSMTRRVVSVPPKQPQSGAVTSRPINVPSTPEPAPPLRPVLNHPPPRPATNPGRNATLPTRPYVPGEQFTSNYEAAPQPKDSEAATGRNLGAPSPTWEEQARVRQPSGGNLMSTVPEYTEQMQNSVNAVEVKDLGLGDMRPNYRKWAEQLARRIHAFAAESPGKTLSNWLYVDLRGSRITIDLAERARLIRSGVAEAGRVGNVPGPTFDRLLFILDNAIVEMPPPPPP